VTRAAPAALLIALLAVAGCSSDEGSGSTTTGATTTGAATSVAGSTPSLPTTSQPVVTQPVPTAPSTTPALPVPPKPDPGTTTTAGPNCDAATLFAVLQSSVDLPAGTGAAPPICGPGWATMEVGAPGQERALAVFEARSQWIVRNLGTSAVCTDAGVPPNIFDVLGCADWEG
jgi:hypothetical protein